MTNTSLAQSYLMKAIVRLKVLELLMREEAYSDVVREAQEIVELALKGMLRQAGVDPPKMAREFIWSGKDLCHSIRKPCGNK